MIRRLLAACALVTIATTTLAQEAADDAAADATQPATAPAVVVAPGTPVPLRIMTFNCENWTYRYQAKKALATTKPGLAPNIVEALKTAREDADEQDWETARNVLDVRPDVWVLQEGCDVPELNRFNLIFLRGYFETVHVFKNNSERGQFTAILLRPGFKALEFHEQYHDEPDPGNLNTYGAGKLFARGPGFCKIQAPNGTVFWVGTNHAKSKSGNSVAVTKWRLAEAKRTNEIINEIKKAGPAPVFFLGDMNDELGYQEFEQEAGGSAIETIAGTGDRALLVLTKKLAEDGAISYHGSRAARFRSFIDHAFATPEAAPWVKEVHVFHEDLADVASDHYPVVINAIVP